MVYGPRPAASAMTLDDIRALAPAVPAGKVRVMLAALKQGG